MCRLCFLDDVISPWTVNLKRSVFKISQIKCPKCPSEAHLWKHLSFLHRFLNILRIIYLLLQKELFCYWQAAFLSDKTLHGLNEREEMLSGLCLKTALFKTASFLLISVPAVIKDEPPLQQEILIRDRKTHANVNPFQA